MKRSAVCILNDEFEWKKSKSEKTRDERLDDFKAWCIERKIEIATSVKFDTNCIAGHGLRAIADINEGDELVRIPRAATIYHSTRLEKAFKRSVDIRDHRWISVILSMMVEWGRNDSVWTPYIDWLPDVGELADLPHNWSGQHVALRKLLGLDEQVTDDTDRIKADWERVLPFVKKNLDLFLLEESELEPLFYHCALLMMCYSFTDPQEEEESDDGFCTEKVTKEDPIRFMLPVGDLLNHTLDNNAQIEFE